MTAIVLDRLVQTDYGQFDIGWGEEFGFDGHFERFFDGQVNGLVGAAHPSGVYLHLARRSGGSPLRIDLLDSRPDPPSESWEDVVEVSVRVPDDAAPRWSTWAGETGGALAIPPGDYRLRVSACGRDAGHDGEFAAELVDRYVLEFWRASMEPDSIVKVGSADAAYWHAEIGGRR